MLTARAPAKVNLWLHVVGRRADGYHDIDSLVAFAGTGDTVALTPGPELSLAVSGPTASASGDPAENLVTKAAREFAHRVPGARLGTFRLGKRLPVAAGLGGGSSDAAAALRLLARLNGIDLEHPAVMAAAQATGADVPVCVAGRARIMTGMGERLGPARQAFLEGYRATTRGAAFLPQDDASFDSMLDAFELEKMLYEVRYELQNRPDWVRIPVQALMRMEVRK